MADFLLELPKAELHLHLEGSVEPETLRELDPGIPENLYEYADFEGFLKAFGVVGKALRGPDEYAFITRRLLQRLEEQNVKYAEIIFAARSEEHTSELQSRVDISDAVF